MRRRFIFYASIARHHRDADLKGLRYAQKCIRCGGRMLQAGSPFDFAQGKTLCSPEWEGASLTSGFCEKRSAWHALSKS
jgi:hypothetical protein